MATSRIVNPAGGAGRVPPAGRYKSGGCPTSERPSGERSGVGRIICVPPFPPCQKSPCAPRAGLRMLTVGTDCSVGKMYTTLAMEREMRGRGIQADFRATRQTGILIAGSGVPIDALVADFISGGAEWVSPAREDGGWDLIEGQGSLFHPSFAGVSLALLHGSQPDVIVMCHEAGRQHMRGLPHYSVPSLKDCIEANLTAARLTNAKVSIAGVALNTSLMPVEAGIELCGQIERELGLPCQDPVTMGTSKIVDRMLECVAK